MSTVWREKIPTREERATALLASERAADRDAKRALFIGAALCFLWLAVGLFCLSWAVHTTDAKIGQILFWGGLILGNTGIVTTIAWTVKRAEARGDLGR